MMFRNQFKHALMDLPELQILSYLHAIRGHDLNAPKRVMKPVMADTQKGIVASRALYTILKPSIVIALQHQDKLVNGLSLNGQIDQTPTIYATVHQIPDDHNPPICSTIFFNGAQCLFKGG